MGSIVYKLQKEIQGDLYQIAQRQVDQLQYIFLFHLAHKVTDDPNQKLVENREHAFLRAEQGCYCLLLFPSAQIRFLLSSDSLLINLPFPITQTICRHIANLLPLVKCNRLSAKTKHGQVKTLICTTLKERWKLFLHTLRRRRLRVETCHSVMTAKGWPRVAKLTHKQALDERNLKPIKKATGKDTSFPAEVLSQFISTLYLNTSNAN